MEYTQSKKRRTKQNKLDFYYLALRKPFVLYFLITSKEFISLFAKYALMVSVPILLIYYVYNQIISWPEIRKAEIREEMVVAKKAEETFRTEVLSKDCKSTYEAGYYSTFLKGVEFEKKAPDKIVHGGVVYRKDI